MAKTAIALIDGEHYLPVLQDALSALSSDYSIVGAVFLGGIEKIGGADDLLQLGVPVVSDTSILSGLQAAVDRFHPHVAIDLSDEPVVGYYERFDIANYLLSHGVEYVGQDFSFVPSERVKMSIPSIGVAGTGKRTGKTAVCGFAARILKTTQNVGIITMGRGGPREPEVLHGEKMLLSAEDLLQYADAGRHAASDHFEDAVTARVVTIGCRRCGGGMSGAAPFYSNVDAGRRLAEKMDLDLVLVEGSGSTMAPIDVDQQILIVGAQQPVDYVRHYFGPYRILSSNLVVLTGCESPLVSEAQVDAMVNAIKTVSPDIPILRTVFRPRPLGPVDGERAFLACTAPVSIHSVLADHLNANYGCKIVGTSSHLSNRPKLREDLAAAPEFDVLLVELKAAGVDVGARLAFEQGKSAIFIDNEPVCIDEENLAHHIKRLAMEAVAHHREGV